MVDEIFSAISASYLKGTHVDEGAKGIGAQ